MRILYFTVAGLATLFALALLGLQIVGGLEFTAGASTYVVASMVAAMIVVAALPLFIDAAWRVSKGLALLLVVGFALFLAYSLPAAIGRIGEVKEVKALAAGDAAQIEAEIKSLNLTIRVAQPQMEAECLSAPDPLPLDKNRWPECRRKRGTVTALVNDRDRLMGELRKMGSARVGDTSSQTVAWMFSALGVSEQTIRRGSGIAFAIGLEIIIATLFALVPVTIRAGLAVNRPAVVAMANHPPRQVPRQAPPPNDGGGKAKTRDEALADLKALLKAGHVPPSQDWLKERWGLQSKGTASKWLSHWEAAGELPGTRRADGRCKTVVSA